MNKCTKRRNKSYELNQLMSLDKIPLPMFTPESIVKDERFVPFISREQIDARISLMGKH